MVITAVRASSLTRRSQLIPGWADLGGSPEATTGMNELKVRLAPAVVVLFMAVPLACAFSILRGWAMVGHGRLAVESRPPLELLVVMWPIYWVPLVLLRRRLRLTLGAGALFATIAVGAHVVLPWTYLALVPLMAFGGVAGATRWVMLTPEKAIYIEDWTRRSEEGRQRR
jgi:hypothetical protein